MFRLICLVKLTDGADVDAIVDAAREMVADEPNIIAGEVMKGLRKMEDSGLPHASYSLILDFDGEQAWLDYPDGAPHVKFADLVSPHIESLVVTQYEL